MFYQRRPASIPAAAERIVVSADLCGERTVGNLHRVVDRRGDTGDGQRADWSADDQVIGRLTRIAVAFVTVATTFALFTPFARTESGIAQSTLDVTKAYGEWWDSTGTIYSVVSSTVITEGTRVAGGETDIVTVGQITYLEHDFVTGDTYLGVGPVPNAATIRGNLGSASSRATIPLARYDRTTATYVGVGMVTVDVYLKGDGPIVKSNGSDTSTGASNVTVHETFVGSTRNAVPAFAIDGVAMDPSLAHFLGGAISESRTQYTYTGHP